MKKKVLNIDKSTWKLTQLGDLLEDISQRVDNPSESGYERFVGLEHFVSGDIKIRNWGTTENLTSSTKAFKAGDILFARRNAYLRRASLVDFDGCCSGDAFVLRENHKKVVPGFMAFFFNSNAVWDFANENAAGTMSQRVKWRDLANYEFLLPPKDQQAQLAELLWAMDEVIERERDVLNETEKVKYQICLDSFFNGKKVNRAESIELPNSDWRLIPLKGAVPDIEYGISLSIPDNQHDLGIPIISTAEIDREGILDYSIIRRIRYEKMNERVTLQSGDVLFNWRNTAELIGKTAIFQQPSNDPNKHTFASFLLRMRCEERQMNNTYLMQLLNFYRISEIFLGLARKAVNQANFNKNEVGDLLVPVPPFNVQLRIADKLLAVENLKTITKGKISSSQALQKSLINQIF